MLMPDARQPQIAHRLTSPRTISPSRSRDCRTYQRTATMIRMRAAMPTIKKLINPICLRKMGAERPPSAKPLIPQEKQHSLNSDSSERRDNLSMRIARNVRLTINAVKNRASSPSRRLQPKNKGRPGIPFQVGLYFLANFVALSAFLHHVLVELLDNLLRQVAYTQGAVVLADLP